MTTPLFRELARIVDAYHRCVGTGNEWAARHKERVAWLVKNHMPSGSGIDNGTTLDLDASTGERLVFDTAFHHMDDGGGYDGWSDHRVIVKPSLIFTIDVRIAGRDRNDIKSYLADVYAHALRREIDPQTEYAKQTGEEV